MVENEKGSGIVWTTETLTNQLVEDSVRQNINEMSLNIDEWEDLKNQLEVVRGMCDNVSNISDAEGLHVLWVFRDKIVNILKKYSCCKVGCSWCCQMAVGITSIDADNISRSTGIRPRELDELDVRKESLIGTRNEQVNRYMKVPCPFLSEGKCTIYEDRPSACRTHFNVSKFPQVCNLEEFEDRNVPNLDMRELWITEALICYKLKVTMGDIRLYFPHVKEGKVVED